MSQTDNFRQLGQVCRPHWPRLACAVACLVGLSGVNLVLPWVPKRAIDDVFPSGDMGALLLLLALLLGAYLLRNVFYFVAGHQTNQVAERIALDLRGRLVTHLGTLSLDFYNGQNPGKLAARVTDDVAVCQSFIQRQVTKLVVDGFTFVGVVAVVFCINWRLAAVAVSVFPLHAIACTWTRRQTKERAVATREHRAAVSSGILDFILGAPVIKAAATQDREAVGLRHTMQEAFSANMALGTLFLQQKVVADVVVGLGTIGVFCYGGYTVSHAQMTIGSFVAFYSYIATLYPLTARLTARVPEAMSALTSFERIVELLAVEPQDAPAAPDAVIPQIVGDIELRGVDFGYTDRDQVLHDVNLHIRPGENVLVLGANGSGKSTLLSLIPRFHRPRVGQILIDGHDIDSLPVSHLREQIGFVFQEPKLFDLTVRDNIRYAIPDASHDRVESAARNAGAHDLIEGLPDGYDTQLGPQGMQLSPGQRQRVALAQALLKDPKILIIDDSFAAFDAASRPRVWQSVQEAMQGRTVIVSTSDQNGFDNVSRIVRLEDGQAHTMEVRRGQQAA